MKQELLSKFNIGEMRFSKARIAVGACAALAILATVVSADAKPAPRTPITVEQPDGSKITICVRGDEYSRQFFTPEGKELVRNAEGFFVDASTVPAALRAPEQSSRVRDKYIFNGAPFPSEGEPHALVILAQFKDVSFFMNDPKSYYERMLNEEGFNVNGSPGSVRDYFIANSNGVFKPIFDVYGPVTLKDNQRFYGNNDRNGDEPNAVQVCIEACQLLDDEIDFSQYDLNNDGYIDNLYVFYAGYGEADSMLSYTIWPHSANLTDFHLGKTYSFDGKILDRYAMSNELDYQYGRLDGIGTFTHEFSHVLGLPDLYATTYTSSYTPGYYSVLDMGSYNNNGLTPPNYSLFERMSVGWATPQPLATTGDYTLTALQDCNTGFLIPTEKDDEFFLLENRQKLDYDKYLPGHGMLVWHIDFNQHIWDENVVNNTPSHQYVDLIEADNKFSDLNQNGDPFPGQSNITDLSFYTTPALQSWDGLSTGVSLSDIAEFMRVITFYAEIDDNYNSNDVVNIADIDSPSFSIRGRRIYNESDSRLELWHISGANVATLRAGETSDPLPAGIYIARLNGISKKLLIK